MYNNNNNLGVLLNPNLKHNNKSKEAPVRKRGNSQLSFQKISEIITQMKPLSFNNYAQQLSPHKFAMTPSNKSRDMLQPNLLLPSKSIEYNHKKTIILDLDETLVHSSTTSFLKNDIILDVEFDNIVYNIYVLVRPGAENFIKKLAKFYEIVIFTASISRYASPLLDKLDKENNIKYRLYREHCTFLNGIYIKELKRLNRDLKDVIIVDNSPLAYAFDMENGLPIKSWYEDKNDTEFEKIMPLLEFLALVDDVRDYIGLFVENNQIKYEEANKIIKTFNDFDNNKKENKYKRNLDKNNNDLINLNNNNDSNMISNNNYEKKSFNNYNNNKICLYDFLNVNLKNKNKKK